MLALPDTFLTFASKPSTISKTYFGSFIIANDTLTSMDSSLLLATSSETMLKNGIRGRLSPCFVIIA